MLPAVDLERAATFYRDTLGLSQRAANMPGTAEFDCGSGTFLSLYDLNRNGTAVKYSHACHGSLGSLNFSSSCDRGTLPNMNKEEIRRRVRETLPRLPIHDRVKRVSLFGSHARQAETNDSDIDLLVEFSTPVGYFDLVGMERGLEKSLGKRVDLVTPESLSKFFRADVLQEAEPIYER